MNRTNVDQSTRSVSLQLKLLLVLLVYLTPGSECPDQLHRLVTDDRSKALHFLPRQRTTEKDSICKNFGKLNRLLDLPLEVFCEVSATNSCHLNFFLNPL